MRPFACILRAALITLACGLSLLAANADPLPKGFYSHRFNPVKVPPAQDGVLTFRVENKLCSNVDYDDGRHETDCRNGNARQMIGMTREAKMGEALSYKFDIWVDPSFEYPGFSNDNSYGFLPDGMDSRLRIASWEGQYIKNFIYMLKLDARHGISFLGKTCQDRTALGTWTTFELRTLWANNGKGWVSVSCDGKVIYEKKDLATNVAPHCYATNECIPGEKKNPSRIFFALGPVMGGFGPEWKKYGLQSQFTFIQKEGITIKMRNIAVTPIAKDEYAN